MEKRDSGFSPGPPTTDRLLDLGARQPKVRRGIRATWARSDKRRQLYDWSDWQGADTDEWVLRKEFQRW